MRTTVEVDEVSGEPSLDGWVRAGAVEELRRRGCTVVAEGGPSVAVFFTGDRAYAVDNRCPHMGFPLSRGTVQNGILTCHWHHARFDLESGGTFDPFADDVRVYPTRIVSGEVWMNLHLPAEDRVAHWKARLQDGLEQNISLVMAKAVLALQEAGVPAREVVSIGGTFGAQYRRAGWGPGLTILTAMANVLPHLEPEDRMLAVFHGMAHVAEDVDGQPPWFPLDPLPTRDVPFERLKAWFRRFVEVRDTEGAERVVLTCIAAATGVDGGNAAGADGRAEEDSLEGAAGRADENVRRYEAHSPSSGAAGRADEDVRPYETSPSRDPVEPGADAGVMERQVADLMLAACTDHYFLAGGHVMDFVNKGFEFESQVGGESQVASHTSQGAGGETRGEESHAMVVLPSLVRGICTAQRSEELNSWRNPVDLVELLEPIFARLPGIIEARKGEDRGAVPENSGFVRGAGHGDRGHDLQISAGEDRTAVPEDSGFVRGAGHGDRGHDLQISAGEDRTAVPEDSGFAGDKGHGDRDHDLQISKDDVFTGLVPVLLGDDAGASANALVLALESGAELVEIGSVLAYAAALRIARFHTSNEFGDWITVLHTFSYCNALHRNLERAPSAELARGIFHGAMRIYLDRFLNMPATRLPDELTVAALPSGQKEILAYLDDLLDREQQVNKAGDAVYRYLSLGHPDGPLLATLGHLLVREDAEFHSYQMVEAGFRQYRLLMGTHAGATEDRPSTGRAYAGPPLHLADRSTEAGHVLIAVARYLAAHSPTSRAMLQTARNATRLARGESLYEDVSL
jgi:nitrite reductase/ring-hydroxylating ferredoxin subunit